MRKLILPAIVLAALVYLLFFRSPPLQEHREQFLALGTLFDVTLRVQDDAAAHAAISAIRWELGTFNSTWHPWQRGARLAKLNEKLAQSGEATIPTDMFLRVQQAQKLARQSENLFDPAIGNLVKLWGFHEGERADIPPPTAAMINAFLKTHLKFGDLPTADKKLIANQNTALDFGAFAKGYALDLAIARLRDAGVEHALVNAGGDLRGIGHAASGRAWRIGIRHPRQPEQAIASIDLQADESVFTSGDYERFFMDNSGARQHHILDPRTGQPARGAISVTVIHPDAATADAASTALFVAGPNAWPEIAAQMQVDLVMLVTESGEIQLSPKMAERIELLADNVEPTILPVKE